MALPSLLLVVVSAGLYVLAFAPVGAGVLAWVALAPLFVAAARAGVARGAALGAVWGLAITVGLGWPLPGMLARYFDVGPWIGWPALLVVGTLTAAVPVAAMTGWLGWAAGRGAAGPLGIAAAWGAMELVRGRVAANPWGLVAYSQAGAERVRQLADVAGPYGIGMLVVAVNAALAMLACRALGGRHPVRAAGGVAALVVAALAYGEWRLGTTFAAGPGVEVALVQPGAVSPTAGWLDLTHDAVATGPALVVWAENAVDENLEREPRVRRAVADAAAGADVLVGAPSYVWGQAGIRRRNSVFLLRDGRIAGRYDKRRLLPIAEWRPRGFAGAPAYEPGRHARTLRSTAGRVGAIVCFEAMFPELVRPLATGGAEVLANLSNDVWFGHAAAAEHHLAMAALRAVENRRWLLRGATTGVSALVDPHGRVVARRPFGERGLVLATVAPSRTITPYHRWGDAPVAIAAAVPLTLPFTLPLARRFWRRRPGIVHHQPKEISDV